MVIVVCQFSGAHFSDILWLVKQLWRQLLLSWERSCSGCERKPPSGDWIGWEELWQRSVEITCEKWAMLRGCQLGQTAAVSGYRCQNCEKRCWHIWLLRLRRREVVWLQVVWTICVTGMKSYFCCTTRPIIVKMLVYFEWWQIECWLKRVVRYPLKYRTTWTCLPAIMFGSGYDCLLLYSSDILWFVKQLWRQLLRSQERSCSSCKRKPPSGGGIGWEERWLTSVERNCEQCASLRVCQSSRPAAKRG